MSRVECATRRWKVPGRPGRARVALGVLVVATACAGGRGESEAPAPAAPVPADTVTTAATDSAAISDRSDPVDAPTAEAADGDAERRGGEPSPAADTMAERFGNAAETPPTGSVAPLTLPVPVLPGALLPFHRIVAFYGNPASPHMGILGELPPDELLARLDAEVQAWEAADPATPVRPALQIIAVMATGDPGRDSLYRLRAPDARIRRVSDWIDRRDGLLFLDIQPGRSTVEAELPPLETWLARSDVHLALDPEWAMPPDGLPGRQIGSMTADEINHAVTFLAELVERYHLPPKILVVHRFTESMIEDAHRIRRDPRVQVVINMDGWGSPPQKRAAYRDIVAPQADQFTGFKLFFRNDRRDGSVLLTPEEILQLEPPPAYIQYQ